MIDTIILLVGFFGVALITSLCALEYSYCFKQSAVTNGLKKLFSLTPDVHSFVLSAACICTFVVFVVSAQFNKSLDIEVQAAASNKPSTGALILEK